MSGVFESWITRFHNRQRLRHAMFKHLGIDIPEEKAPACFEELRAAMLACNRCRNVGPCESWIAQRQPGAPHFCPARSALKVLKRATPAKPDVHEAAE